MDKVIFLLVQDQITSFRCPKSLIGLVMTSIKQYIFLLKTLFFPPNIWLKKNQIPELRNALA